MRIYPGNHKIVSDSEVKPNDIPLAYVNTNYTDYDIKIVPDDNFNTEIKKEVIPYSSFESRDIFLFDKNNNEVENIQNSLQFNGSEYLYVPQNAVSFSPQRFNYQVIGKKHMQYKTNKTYNLKASCVDDPDNLVFANKLMRVFGDAPKRNICPQNISVNNQDISIESLTSSTIEENDFVFIESHDALHYKDTTTVIDFDAYLKKHTNLWISLNNVGFPADAPMVLKDQETSFVVAKPVVFNVNDYKSKYEFNIPNETPDGIKYHSIFYGVEVPILIVEHKDKGFVIFSHNSFFDNIDKNVNIFYEILMDVYCNTYLETNPINEWIADTVPDFIVSNNKLIQKDKFTSYIELPKMFGLESSEITLSSITIDSDNIVFMGMSKDYILFKKQFEGAYDKYADPVKPQNSISIFTPRQDIIYFDKLIYEIKDSISDKILIYKTPNEIIATVRPFKHSKFRINVKTDTPIRIPLVKTENYKEIRIDKADIYICCNENILNYVIAQDYDKDKNGIKVATIKIDRSIKSTQLFDMRQRGGGLPEDEEPNYSLFDIGHVLGRPYRKAGTLVITLPKYLEQYEDIILKAIKQYMVAEELPLILFEEE